MVDARRTAFLRAFVVSMLGTGASRVLGAARDIAMAAYLGAGAGADAFNIAFRVPNTFRRFVADEGLTGALIPAFAEAEARGGPDEARRLANALLGGLLVVNAALCIVGMLASDYLVYAFAAAFAEDPEKFALTSAMTRWLFPFVSMVSMVSFYEAMLNHRGHFFVPKIAPGLVNIGMIAGLVLASSFYVEPAWALVYGTLIGGVAHVLVHLPSVFTLWRSLVPRLDLTDPSVRSVGRELSKVVVIGLFGQLNLLVLSQLAADVGPGAVTHYTFATRVVDLAQGVVAVAIGSAMLPQVSQAVAEGAWDRFRGDFSSALRLAAFLLVPVAVVLSALALPVTSVLFRHGAFGWEDTVRTASTLQLLTPFLLGVAGINLVKRVYFALGDRNTLLWVGALGVLLTGFVGYTLVQTMGLAGLGVALSVATVAQLATYLGVLRWRLGSNLGLDLVVGPLARITAAAVPAGLVAWGVQTLGDWPAGPLAPLNVAVLAVALGLSGLVYIAAAWLLGIGELVRLVSRLRARLGR